MSETPGVTAVVVLNDRGQMVARFPDVNAIPDEMEDDYGDLMRVDPRNIRTFSVSEIPSTVPHMTTCPRCGKVTRIDDVHTCSPQVVASPPDAEEVPEWIKHRIESARDALKAAPDTPNWSMRRAVVELADYASRMRRERDYWQRLAAENRWLIDGKAAQVAAMQPVVNAALELDNTFRPHTLTCGSNERANLMFETSRYRASLPTPPATRAGETG